MRVTLLNKDSARDLFNLWGEFSCTCYNTPKQYKNGVGKSCLNTKHFSGSRAFYLNFEISGVSRACIDQLVRSEIGVAKNVQSGRYVRMSDFDYHTPSVIRNCPEAKEIYDKHMKDTRETYNKLVEILESQGFRGEKVNEASRGVLPMNHNSAVTIGFTVEALINLCHKRLCVCSQEEIQALVRRMRDIVIEILPELKPYLVPVCVASNYCPEKPARSCGAFPQKDVVDFLVRQWKKHQREGKKIDTLLTEEYQSQFDKE